MLSFFSKANTDMAVVRAKHYTYEQPSASLQTANAQKGIC